jgi:hypothetical protein
MRTGEIAMTGCQARWALALVLLVPCAAFAGPPASEPAPTPGIKPGELETVDSGTAAAAKLPEIREEAKLRRPRRATIGVELGGAVAVPFKNYLSFGSGTNAYYMENGVGGGVALSVTLNDVEVRWQHSILSTGRVKGRIPDSVLPSLQLIDKTMGGTGQIAQDIDIEATGALVMDSITFGYRLTFAPARRFHIVVPIGAGVVAAQPPRFGLLAYTLWGFAADVGLRGEVLLAKILALGLDTRFDIYLTEPDPNLGAAGYAGTKNAFDAAVAWLPMLSVSLYARVYY